MINVSNTSKYNVTSSINDTMVTSIITIMNTQSSDAGNYTCCVKNIIDIDCSSGILTVNGMLGVPHICDRYLYTATIQF